MRSNIARSHAAADYPLYDYPGEYVQSQDGEQYARTRIEALQALRDRRRRGRRAVRERAGLHRCRPGLPPLADHSAADRPWPADCGGGRASRSRGSARK
ncbi:contractile injection system protein, VgrG/Pvc8 family [Pseudomonas aeruginosa]|uniref:contractile injection system protein, VgrG/Pvc8 family n=1 Tax=Pseudomonas aeruginosa TaxID=287 RepID=UPI0039C0362B